MTLINYPPCPGAGRAARKYRFAESPPLWVGPLVACLDRRTLAERLWEGAEKCEKSRAEGVGGTSIRVAADAAPVRKVITGRKIFPTGTYSSEKCGRSHQYEGMNEHAAAEFMEADPGVASYAAQAVAFLTVISGRPVRYTADFVRLLVDGRLQVLEVKSQRASIRNPKYIHKLKVVRATCEALGWEFIVVEGRTLRASNVFNLNIAFVVRRRFAAVPTALAMVVQRHIARNGGSVELGELIDLCAPGPLGLELVCALIYRGVLRVDFRYPLTRETRVEHNSGIGGR